MSQKLLIDLVVYDEHYKFCIYNLMKTLDLTEITFPVIKTISKKHLVDICKLVVSEFKDFEEGYSETIDLDQTSPSGENVFHYLQYIDTDGKSVKMKWVLENEMIYNRIIKEIKRLSKIK